MEGLWTYLTVFGLLIGAGFGLPIPEELPVVGAGVAAAHASSQVPREHPYWWILWPVCIIGVVISDWCLYCVGRFGGRRLLNLAWVRKHLLHPEKQAQIEQNIHKHGIKILLGARFLPGVRAPIFVMSGMTRMPILQFLTADGIYAIPGVSLLFFLAFWFTDSFLDIFNRVQGQIEVIRPLIILIALAAISGYLIYYIIKRAGKVNTGEPPEAPQVHLPHLPHLPLPPMPFIGDKDVQTDRGEAPTTSGPDPSANGQTASSGATEKEPRTK